jgi:enterochelin esterase family protein
LVPEIDRNFRTLPNREQRAIAGLSMGAGQALTIANAHPELFAYVGAFSGGARGFDAARWKDKPFRLLWLGYGSEDGGYQAGKQAHEAMESAGVKHVWFEGPGSHEWQVWRKHLHAFAPLLFAK